MAAHAGIAHGPLGNQARSPQFDRVIGRTGGLEHCDILTKEVVSPVRPDDAAPGVAHNPTEAVRCAAAGKACSVGHLGVVRL